MMFKKNLGFFFQFSLCTMNFQPDDLQKKILESEIPYQIEIGNPDFLCGKSGIELAEIALGKIVTGEKIVESQSDVFYPEAEYWSGVVLAYCQWNNNLPFRKILDKFPLSKILDSYHLLHDADISKIEEVILDMMGEI